MSLDVQLAAELLDEGDSDDEVLAHSLMEQAMQRRSRRIFMLAAAALASTRTTIHMPSEYLR